MELIFFHVIIALLNFLNGRTKLAYCDEEPSFISLDISGPLIVDPVGPT